MIEARIVFVDSRAASDSRLPLGGVKSSGYGRELSMLGIREFSNIKMVSISAKHQQRHLHPPAQFKLGCYGR